MMVARAAPWSVRAAAPGRWQAALVRAQAMRDAAVRSGIQAYGAVVADAQGRVVAEAPSRVVALNDPEAHGERQAMKEAQLSLGREDLGGLVLVGSSRACPMWQRAAAQAGVARLVWTGGESEPVLIDAAERGEKILTHLGLQARAPPRAPARGSQLPAA
jgi:tRNA(adenine34) deaminase